MPNVVRFKYTDVPRQVQELARFKVVQGPDFGALYVVTGPKASIGRGEDNDLVISDLKASRNHALLLQTRIHPNAVGWKVKDQGSANGILHNGNPTREAVIKLGDTLTLGETTLEFVTAEASTMMLKAPVRSIRQIQGDQQTLQKRRNALQANFKSIFSPKSSTAPSPAHLATSEDLPGGQTFLRESGNSPAGSGLLRNPILLLVLGGGVLFLLFSSDNSKRTPLNGSDLKPPRKVGEPAEAEKRNLAAYLPSGSSSPAIDRSADTLFKDGMREYFLGNYSRARSQFETVLQINPGHTLANIYFQNCVKAIEDEVKLSLENGKKSFQAGKLREARGHFQRVMRLLYRDQTSSAFIEAKEQLEKVSTEITGEITGNSGDTQPK